MELGFFETEEQVGLKGVGLFNTEDKVEASTYTTTVLFITISCVMYAYSSFGHFQ